MVFYYLITNCVCVCVCVRMCARACVCLPVHVCSQNSLKEEEKKDDIIHIGNSIMTFYAALIDLLGRCAPEKHVSSQLFPHPPSQTYTGTYAQNINSYLNLFYLS